MKKKTMMGIISLLLVVVLFFQLGESSGCGYQACQEGKKGFINVHLVPHTHDDVGWLKTVDQYYYGARNDIQDAGVQYIIDSVIQELELDPSRRFIYVEMAFFNAWWKEQTEVTKQRVKDLVSAGRLEFINGGWCMNDEATTHYVDIIDQMSLGLKILNETFGECGRPRVSWQIDPFGHSREQALLFAQMGYDGLFFGRLDYQDKRERMSGKTMEMLWSASNHLGNDGRLFTGVNYNLYQAPSGFCFDVLCGDEPIIDNPKSKDFNVHKRVTDFLRYCKEQSEAYGETGNIMLTMGGDFTYMDANMWYKNMDKLIKYANERQATGSKFNLFYSTPSCYAKALNDLEGRSWPIKSGDFFPYGSDAHSYWTGYFTSRPALKQMVRQGSNLLQACKQMASYLAIMTGQDSPGPVLMEEAMGILQHHDAVSGTEKQHVANDYARLVHEGVVQCQTESQASYYQKKLPVLASDGRRTTWPLPPIFSCQLNVSRCDASERNAQFVVNVYNSLSRRMDKYVRVPVPAGSSAYLVLDPEGNEIDSQMVPIADFVKSLPERKGSRSQATDELVFLASQLPPVGSKSYYVQKVARAHGRHHKSRSILNSRVRTDHTISSDKLVVKVDGATGLLKSITNKAEGLERFVRQEFLWYKGFNGDNRSAQNRSSGAYIFRPDGSEAYPIFSPKTPAMVTAVYTGPLVQEIHQVYDTWVSQIICIYSGQDHVEFDWVVGPIPVGDRVGKEIISRVTTTIPGSGRIFYTDANGRQTLERISDYRDSYNYSVTEPVASNYYPVNSHIFIKDPSGRSQAHLLVDRSQGGSSLKGGQMELMVHRRLLHDDSFGVDEALNETAFLQGLVVRGTHLYFHSSAAEGARKFRPLSQELYRQPQITFIPTTLSYLEWTSRFKTQTQEVRNPLPDNVNLLTLEPHSNGRYLVRLEHIYDVGEDEILSKPAIVSLEDLFPGFALTSIKEAMLGGNQWKEDSHRLVWNSSNEEDHHKPPSTSRAVELPEVELQPMQIRTFVVTLGRLGA